MGGISKRKGEGMPLRPQLPAKGISLRRLRREGYLELYLLMVPAFAILFIFKYIPLNGIVIAFQDFNIFKGISGSDFVGFDNFRRMFGEPDFLRALRNTFAINPFEQILVMYNPAVYDVGDIINTYVYRMGVNNMQYGYASAVGLFNGLVGLLFLMTANYLCRKFLDKSIW